MSTPVMVRAEYSDGISWLLFDSRATFEQFLALDKASPSGYGDNWQEVDEPHPDLTMVMMENVTDVGDLTYFVDDMIDVYGHRDDPA